MGQFTRLQMELTEKLFSIASFMKLFTLCSSPRLTTTIPSEDHSHTFNFLFHTYTFSRCHIVQPSSNTDHQIPNNCVILFPTPVSRLQKKVHYTLAKYLELYHFRDLVLPEIVHIKPSPPFDSSNSIVAMCEGVV